MSGPVLRERELIQAASPEQLEALKQNRIDDVEIQRPLWKQWKDNLPANLLLTDKE